MTMSLHLQRQKDGSASPPLQEGGEEDQDATQTMSNEKIRHQTRRKKSQLKRRIPALRCSLNPAQIFRWSRSKFTGSSEGGEAEAKKQMQRGQLSVATDQLSVAIGVRGSGSWVRVRG